MGGRAVAEWSFEEGLVGGRRRMLRFNCDLWSDLDVWIRVDYSAFLVILIKELMWFIAASRISQGTIESYGFIY